MFTCALWQSNVKRLCHRSFAGEARSGADAGRGGSGGSEVGAGGGNTSQVCLQALHSFRTWRLDTTSRLAHRGHAMGSDRLESIDPLARASRWAEGAHL